MGVTNDDTATTTRRTVLAGAGAAGVAVTLAGCGTAPGGSTSSGSGSGGGNGGGSAIKTADIPVDGGKVYGDSDTVVTQPAAGTYKAFSATCTHMGCTVGKVENNVIICPCHGSQYNATDGSVKHGPATKGLTPKTATVSGDTITVS